MMGQKLFVLKIRFWKMSYHKGNQFFKVLHDPSSSVLTVPESMNTFFSVNMLNNTMVTITTVLCKSWSVRVSLIEDIVCFTDGWSEVVNDLSFGTFVMIFNYIGHKTFLMKYFNHSPHQQLGNSFFKIIEHELTTPPVIPCSFVKTHYPNGLPVKPVNLYVSDDFQWNVSMQNIDTNVCFSDGWIDFLTDLRLNVGDALCFELSENGRFKVTTFSKSGRQMRLFKILSVSNPDEKNNVVTLNPNVQQYPRLPGFTCNVTTELVIPNQIADIIGLNKSMNLRIKFINGNSWNVPVHVQVVSGNPRYIVIGWRELIESEGIPLGQAYMFKWSTIHRKLLVGKYANQEVIDIKMQ